VLSRSIWLLSGNIELPRKARNGSRHEGGKELYREKEREEREHRTCNLPTFAANIARSQLSTIRRTGGDLIWPRVARYMRITYPSKMYVPSWVGNEDL
jgi:hypothetical protein